VSAGVVLCWVLMLRRTTRLGLPPVKVYLWFLTAFPVGALGAGAAAGLVRMAQGHSGVALAGVGTSGMTVLGAVVACLLYSLLYIRLVLRVSPWPLLDAVAFSYPLALAFGRLGCLMNGCCYGRPAPDSLGPLTVPLAAYDPVTPARAHYASAPWDTTLWNLPVILALLALVTVAVTEGAYRRREAWRLPAGAVLLIALLTDATTRFAAEFLREEGTLGWVPLNPWQTWVAALWLLGAALLAWLLLLRRAPRHRARPGRAA
jgi:phosphatidylglycerol:prolipoprotein diacylglycerol transferase